MPRYNKEPKVRIHLWVYESDAEFLKTAYGETIGFSAAICSILRMFVRKLQAAQEAQSPLMPLDEEQSL